jgi:hypothetical protein
MAKVLRPLERNDYPSLDGICDACGGDSTAYWHGVARTIQLCPWCAERVGAAMLADATLTTHSPTTSDFKSQLVRFSRDFWLSVASRIAAEHRDHVTYLERLLSDCESREDPNAEPAPSID